MFIALILALQAIAIDAPAPISVKESIDRAQKLFLAKDRVGACQILSRAAQRELKGSANQRELIRALDQIANYFITEKGQTHASLARSLSHEKPREAIGQFKVSLIHDPSHAGVWRESARLFLRLGDCSNASKLLKGLEALDPYSNENKIIGLQVSICQLDMEALATRLAQNDIEGMESEIRYSQLTDAVAKKETKKVLSLLASWEVIDPQHPEILRFKWVASQLQAKPDRAAAEKYLNQCRTLSPQLRKKFELNPFLCLGIDAVSKEVKELVADANN